MRTLTSHPDQHILSPDPEAAKVSPYSIWGLVQIARCVFVGQTPVYERSIIDAHQDQNPGFWS